MKKILTLCALALSMNLTYAQQAENNHRKDLINTVKERVKLYGYVQAGYTYSDMGGEKSNTFDIKRAIIWGHAQITDQWSAQLMYNFGGTGTVNKATAGKILEAWTQYDFIPQLRIRVGQFKTPFSIENPMSPTSLETIDCNAQVVNYLLGGLIGNHGGRDMGIMVEGDLFGKTLDYSLAVMQGQGLNVKDGNNQKEFVGRLSVYPIDCLQISGSFMTGTGHATTPQAYNAIVAGENFKRERWAVGALLKLKPFTLRSEYLNGKDGNVRIDGVYASTTIHLIKKLDAIGSYDYINRNHDLGAKQTNITGGLQYWFYPQCRIQAQYTYSDRKLGVCGHAIQTQLQVRF